MKIDQEIVEAAKTVIEMCLRPENDSKIMVLCDENKIDIAYNFVEAARELELESILVEYKSIYKGEPLKAISDMMLEFDYVIAMTSMSLSHTKARGAANEAGVRFVSMPMYTEEIAKKYLKADYREIEKINNILLEKFKGGKKIKITTDLGTNLEMSIENRELLSDDGNISKPGSIGNLPAGEVYIAPIENSANGTLVIDGVIAYLDPLDAPVKLEIKEGKIIDISGGRSAEELKEFLSDKDSNADIIAELGIGTNKVTKLINHPLTDEKVWETIHIAFGTNLFMGGTNESNTHYDCIVTKPNVYLDDELILDQGKHIYLEK